MSVYGCVEGQKTTKPVSSSKPSSLSLSPLSRPDGTAEVMYAESSMKNGFGLMHLHKFLSIPFLQLQVPLPPCLPLLSTSLHCPHSFSLGQFHLSLLPPSLFSFLPPSLPPSFTSFLPLPPSLPPPLPPSPPPSLPPSLPPPPSPPSFSSQQEMLLQQLQVNREQMLAAQDELTSAASSEDQNYSM